jgi:acetylornithine deacetylase
MTERQRRPQAAAGGAEASGAAVGTAVSRAAAAGAAASDALASDALTDAEQRAADAVDLPHLLDDLKALVAAPSHDGRETPAQDVAAGLMGDAGLQVDRWRIDLDELRRHPAFSWEVERDEAVGVVGTIGGAGGMGPDGSAARDLIFNGHIDVVPPGDLDRWTSSPWQAEIRDGMVYGRGAVDMKGGIACALAAVRALRTAGIGLRGRLFVETVAGEEDGGLGTLAAIVRGYRADGAVVVEPTALTIVAAQAGCLGFRLTVPGRAAHGAMRWEGVSALERFAPIHEALLALERSRTAADLPEDIRPLFAGYPIPYPLSIGVVRAGNWASTVPEELICEGRYGVMPGEDAALARRRFEDAVAAAAAADPWLRDHPPIVEWPGGQYASALTPTSSAVVTAVGGAHASLTGAPPPLAGVTYGADMGMLSAVGGVETILYGPGDVGWAHQADEHVPVAELEQAARVLVVTAMRFCGTV